MTSLSAVNSRNLPVLSKDMAEKKLGQNDFLRLMTTQLKEQDPFNPVDNQAMVAQMAQFSSVAGISEMNTSLKSISEQISAQTELLANIKASATTTASSATNQGV
jgi:flagellar basal-body rod modification protein FlgD